MDDLYLKILKEGYGIKLYEGVRTRTGFVCKTDKGFKEIRKVSNDVLRLSAEYELRKYMNNNGFKISVFEDCTNGDFFYEVNGTKYVLEESMQGTELDFSDFEQALKGAYILADFHNSSEGFKSNSMQNDADKIPDTFIKRYKELKRIRRRIKESRKYSPIDMVIIENFETVSDMIENSLDILEKCDYINIKNQKSKNTVCHNTYKGDNVRILDDGSFTVTNIDKCSHNFIAHDISDFLRRLVKSEVFDNDDIIKIFYEYSKKREISDFERNIIKAFLIFPQKFLSICNEYYNKRTVCISDAMLDRFSKSAAILKKNTEIAQKL